MHSRSRLTYEGQAARTLGKHYQLHCASWQNEQEPQVHESSLCSAVSTHAMAPASGCARVRALSIYACRTTSLRFGRALSRCCKSWHLSSSPCATQRRARALASRSQAPRGAGLARSPLPPVSASPEVVSSTFAERRRRNTEDYSADVRLRDSLLTQSVTHVADHACRFTGGAPIPGALPQQEGSDTRNTEIASDASDGTNVHVAVSRWPTTEPRRPLRSWITFSISPYS